MQTSTGSSTEALVQKLSALVAGIDYEKMPAADITSIKRLILDTLGCAIGALGSAPVQMLEPMLLPPIGLHDTATVIGMEQKTAVASAILANGALVRYLDFMDVYWARDVCHPSENIPVALACAESAGLDGRRFIEAVAVGYEVQLRLADAFSFQDMGMHHVSAAGFVAPLVAGKAWGLSESQLAHACALGGFRHLSLDALLHGSLSMAKAVGYALPASESILTTRLASKGFTGPLTVLEGLWRSSRDQSAPSLSDVLDLTPGTDRARKVSFKQFPVQYTLQSPVEAALELRCLLKGSLSGIDRIVIEAHELTSKRTADYAKFHPENRETADHSMPCCVALALLDGTLDTSQFESGRWADDDVRALMQRIDVRPSAELEREYEDGRPIRFTAFMKNGEQHHQFIPIPMGDVNRPLSDEALESKFVAMSEPLLGAARSRKVVELIRDLEQLPDVRQLTSLLSCARPVLV